MINKEAISVFKAWIERDKEMEYADRLENIEIYEMAIKALEQTTWIPVSERLPELGAEVLVDDPIFGRICATFEKVIDFTGKYKNVFSTHYSINTDEWVELDPVAWIPLPKSYEESDADADDD